MEYFLAVSELCKYVNKKVIKKTHYRLKYSFFFPILHLR